MIRILTDSTCDLPQTLLDSYHIGVVPLRIHIGNQVKLDGAEITPAQIFAHTDATGELCTTSSPNIGEFLLRFQEDSPRADAVICITIGAGFSSCYQNACIAAEEFSNIYVVDSQSLSSGQGLVVLEAGRLAQEGKPLAAILQALQDLIPRVDASFILGRLDYMRKGGRCSSVASLGANLLNIKPCIQVRDGSMVMGRKYRGPLDKVMYAYTRDRLSSCPLAGGTAIIVYPREERTAIEAARRALAEDGRFDTILEADAGGTVACHCGPGTIGVMFAAS